MNDRPKNISLKAQYLSGIGASAWFEITKEKDRYRIKRFSEKLPHMILKVSKIIFQKTILIVEYENENSFYY